MEADILTERIGAAIYILRLEREFTDAGLARSAGVSRGELARIESGEFDFERKEKIVLALCEALETTVDGLLQYSEDKIMPSDPVAARKMLDEVYAALSNGADAGLGDQQPGSPSGSAPANAPAGISSKARSSD